MLLLRKSTGDCARLHFMAGHAFEVVDMRELEDHPICSAYRGQVLDVLEFVQDSLQVRVLADVSFAMKALMIDSMLESCTNCEMLRYRRAQVPPLCTPAHHMGNREDETQTAAN